MKSIERKTVLITGAASGIGRATAHALAGRGARLVLCDVNQTELDRTAQQLADACLIAECADVADAGAMEAFSDHVHHVVPAVDILVNNAGIYIAGAMPDLSLDDWDRILSINLKGMIHTCHYFLPPMLQRGEEGHIVNLASMYGYWPAPGVIGYLTSKFGVFGFSEALREDLRGSGISVSTVCPGIIRSNIIRNMEIRGCADTEAVRQRLEKMYQRRNCTPEKVARQILKAIQKRRKVVPVGIESEFMYRLERYCPPLSRIIARTAARRMFNP